MRYEEFSSRAEADMRVAELRAAGRCAYAVTYRSDVHQVRSWA